jgi:hypothetical protein
MDVPNLVLEGEVAVFTGGKRGNGVGDCPGYGCSWSGRGRVWSGG